MLSLIMAVLCKIVFEIPFMLGFNAWFGLIGLSLSQVAAEILMAAIGMLLLKRLLLQVSKEKKQEQIKTVPVSEPV